MSPAQVGPALERWGRRITKPVATNRAVIYVRFSPRKKHTDTKTLEVQEDRSRAYCKMMNLEVVEVLADPEVSARKTKLYDRPAGKRLQLLVETKQISHVVVSRLDRAFRNAEDGMSTHRHLVKYKCDLHFADEGGNTLCVNTALGHLMFGMLLQFAQFLPELIAERTSQALLARRKNGFLIGPKAPYGYAAVKKRQVPDLEEQKVIYEIMDRYYKEQTVKEISDHLNCKDIKMRGRPWRPYDVTQLVQKEIERRV